MTNFMERLPPALAEAVLKLDQLGECRHWDEFAMVGKGCHYNAMRHLRRRGLIEDAAEPERKEYEGDLAPWIAVPSRYRLTAAGREAARLAHG